MRRLMLQKATNKNHKQPQRLCSLLLFSSVISHQFIIYIQTTTIPTAAIVKTVAFVRVSSYLNMTLEQVQA